MPLIVEQHHDAADPRAILSPNLSFAVTAHQAREPRLSPACNRLAELVAGVLPPPTPHLVHAVLELHDPLDHTFVEADGPRCRWDGFSTPLAHYLSQPGLDKPASRRWACSSLKVNNSPACTCSTPRPDRIRGPRHLVQPVLG